MPNYVAVLAVAGGLGLAGSLCLVITFLVFSKELSNKSTVKVLYMSLCDLGLGAKYLIPVIARTRLDKEKHATLCFISGFFGQFFVIATIGWYFMISVNVFLALKGFTPKFFKTPKVRWGQHLYVWLSALFTALLPLAFDAYGPIDGGAQCWVTTKIVRLVYYGPLGLYLLFAIYLFCFTACGTSAVVPAARRKVLLRLVAFVWVFVITRASTFVGGVWHTISGEDGIPSWVMVLDLACVSGSGFFNFVVWITSPTVAKVVCKRRRKDTQGEFKQHLINNRERRNTDPYQPGSRSAAEVGGGIGVPMKKPVDEFGSNNNSVASSLRPNRIFQWGGSIMSPSTQVGGVHYKSLPTHNNHNIPNNNKKERRKGNKVEEEEDDDERKDFPPTDDEDGRTRGSSRGEASDHSFRQIKLSPPNPQQHAADS